MNCAGSARLRPIISMRSPGWRCFCRWRTVCSMRPVPSRTPWCSTSSQERRRRPECSQRQEECSSYAASAANSAYELTFLFAAFCCIIYVGFIKKQKFTAAQEGPKYLGALCETAGQFAYIFALSDTVHAAISAPIISAYCVASVVWSRIFLKEKLSWKHYAMIALVVVGIVMLGVFDI